VLADTATSLRRGIAVLQALNGAEAIEAGGLGVLRLAELVGQDKSLVSRTLKVLAEYGLVDRDSQTLAYRLGWGVFALAARAGDTRLLEAAQPVLRRLVERLGERAHLSVLRGAEVLTVLSESPPRAIQAAGWVGRTVPAYCTSSGRALLVDHDRDRLGALLGPGPFGRFGPSTPGTLDEVAARVEDARVRGYAVADEELEAGLVAVGAPVRDFRGRVAAAINVSGPKFRFGGQLHAAGVLVAAAAGELSALLGAPGLPAEALT